MSKYDDLKRLYNAEQNLFFKTLLAIDECLDLNDFNGAKHIIEETYSALKQNPFNNSEEIK